MAGTGRDSTAASADRSWILSLLRGDTTATEAGAAAGLSAEQVEERCRAYLDSKLPRTEGTVRAQGAARVRRDRWGVAHVEAGSLIDGYWALGYAMGQDRLWQLDFLRRRARGRLAEVLGRGRLDSDRLMRTLGLAASAAAAAAAAPDEVQEVLVALAGGINAAAEAAAGNWPVEFDLLEHEPEPWTPVDSVAVWKWRWWMLTGRLDLIALEEACKQYLPPDLATEFLATEAADESIVPEPEPEPGVREGGAAGHEPGVGSNNWVVGASRAARGKPVLASDPHNALDHPSQWYEAQLTVPGMDTIGAFYLGTPGIYLGHTRRTAWGLTNHTASGRDLYVEDVRDGDPPLYREGKEWLALKVEVQEVGVRGEAPQELVIRRTSRGPLVNDFVTAVAEGGDPPLSLRWVGSGPITGMEALLGLMRSDSAAGVLAALEQWPFPNLNFVFADADGRLGYHAVGTVPLRRSPWLGYRPAGEADHAWSGTWPFAQLPQLLDPERDWVATANNPPWRGTGPYTALGAWSDGYRFRRIRERIEVAPQLDMAGVAAIHGEVRHPRAAELAPVLAALARGSGDGELEEVAAVLEAWDGAYTVDSPGPTAFEAFWGRWLERLARARFPARLVPLAAGRAASVARRVLLGEDTGWLEAGADAEAEALQVLREAAQWLGEEVGSGAEDWSWGDLHQVRLPHPAAGGNGALAGLLSPGPFPSAGGAGTVRAAGFTTARPFHMTSGSTYRLVVDLAEPERAWSTTTGGISGHPASPQYADQMCLWLEDRYHPLVMDVEEADVEATLVLERGER